MLYPDCKKIAIPQIPANHRASTELVRQVNNWLFDFCKKQKFEFLKYNTALGRDGLHLSDEGKISLMAEIERFRTASNWDSEKYNPNGDRDFKQRFENMDRRYGRVFHPDIISSKINAFSQFL